MAVAVFKKVSNIKIYVTCPKCSSEIRLECAARPPGEFSVVCPNCGERAMHQSIEAHDWLPNPALVRMPRRIEFATRRDMSVAPKSWLDGFMGRISEA